MERGTGLDSNRWLQQLADHSVLVCSGTRKPGESIGALFVELWSADGKRLVPADKQPPVQWFPTPSVHGPVTITGATGEVLTLQATDGTLFYFDVGKLAYVDGPPAESTPTAVAGAAP